MLHRKTAGLLLLLILASLALYAGEAPTSPAAQTAPAAPGVFVVNPMNAPAPAPAAEPAMKTEASLLPSFLALAAGPGCNCDTQCGGCGVLRGCYNGFPICECFHC